MEKLSQWEHGQRGIQNLANALEKREIKSTTAALWDTRLNLFREMENVTLGRWYCHYI